MPVMLATLYIAIGHIVFLLQAVTGLRTQGKKSLMLCPWCLCLARQNLLSKASIVHSGVKPGQHVTSWTSWGSEGEEEWGESGWNEISSSVSLWKVCCLFGITMRFNCRLFLMPLCKWSVAMVFFTDVPFLCTHKICPTVHLAITIYILCMYARFS